MAHVLAPHNRRGRGTLGVLGDAVTDAAAQTGSQIATATTGQMTRIDPMEPVVTVNPPDNSGGASSWTPGVSTRATATATTKVPTTTAAASTLPAWALPALLVAAAAGVGGYLLLKKR